MLAYYKGRKTLLISLFLIIMDGIITYYVPSYINKINYLYPMLTISFIPFIVIINKKKYYLITIIIGLVYDLLYSHIFLYNVILFLILASLNISIAKYFKNNMPLFLVLAIVNIIIYDLIGFLLVIVTNYANVNINDLIYKISHSLLLNIMSVFVYWFWCKNNLYKA